LALVVSMPCPRGAALEVRICSIAADRSTVVTWYPSRARSRGQEPGATSMEAFAERARRELIATGEKVRRRSVETRDQLTPQEEQIALLARDGRTSPEIGAQLFLSERTVEWHLGKMFPKLGIGSRRELHAALVGPGQQDQPTKPKVLTTGSVALYRFTGGCR
jgi:DNA-binding CsgD family transcriptional regulator